MKKERKTHYSISELFAMNLEILPFKTAKSIENKAKKENWAFREVACRGGKGGKKREYLPPPAIQAAIVLAKTERVDVALAPLAPLPSLPTETEAEVVSGSVAATAAVNYLEGTTDIQRQRMGARLGVLAGIEQLMTETEVSKEAAITTFLTTAQHPSHQHLARLLCLANDKRGGGGTLPSVRTIKRWFAARDQGEAALLPALPQKSSEAPDWLPLFLRFYRTPQKPSVQAAYELFAAAFLQQQPLAKPPSVHQARRWLDKMGNVEREKGRMGARALKTIQGFKRRRWQDYLPLDIVCADGQRFDAECGHPDNPNVPIRPEVTLIVDIGTRKIAGVGVDTAESGRAVRAAMVEMMTRYGVAAVFYADNGKGYTNGLLNDETTGLLGRVGMTMVHSAPYSSQARGVIERLHQTVLVKTAKRMQSYIGQDMDGEAARLVHQTTRRAMKQEVALRDVPALQNIASLSPRMLPSFEEMKGLIYQAVAAYNDTPHRSLERVKDVSGSVRRMTPNELRALKEAQMQAAGQCVQKVDKDEQMYLFLPQEVRKIQRCEVHFRSNIYHNEAFTEWRGEEVRVAYDEHNAERIWLFDANGRYLGYMDWNNNLTHYMPKSVVEQARDKRIDTQQARLAVKNSILEQTRAQPKALEHQDSVGFGGLKLDMAALKQRGEALLQQQNEPIRLPENSKVQVLPKPEAKGAASVWRVPATPQARYDEYQRLCQLSADELSPEQARFVDYCTHNPQGQRDMAVVAQLQQMYG